MSTEFNDVSMHLLAQGDAVDMTFSYSGLLAPKVSSVHRLQAKVLELPQYEPKTTHHFYGGLYCREVYRDAGVLVIGRVHRKEHFYQLVSGSILITQDDREAVQVDAPALLRSKPGTKRAVYSLTDAVCMTWHATTATTPEEAELELVEPDESSAYTADNKVKPGYLKAEQREVMT
jgi:hypothetical protein